MVADYFPEWVWWVLLVVCAEWVWWVLLVVCATTTLCISGSAAAALLALLGEDGFAASLTRPMSARHLARHPSSSASHTVR